MKYQILSPFKGFMTKQALSERGISESVGVSRGTLRRILASSAAVTIQSVISVAGSFNCSVDVVISPKTGIVECSTIAVSMKIMADGFDSWKIHIMDLVDEFRRTQDPYLILLPPVNSLDARLKAMLASVVLQLCTESSMQAPEWAQERYFLDEPWFVSGMEELKAFSLLESPLNFRRNNIFVQSNFLERA